MALRAAFLEPGTRAEQGRASAVFSRGGGLCPGHCQPTLWTSYLPATSKPLGQSSADMHRANTSVPSQAELGYAVVTSAKPQWLEVVLLPPATRTSQVVRGLCSTVSDSLWAPG